MKEPMKVYTIEELVDVLHVTRRTIYNYLRSGSLKAAKMGKYWRVTEKQLEDFLQATNEGGTHHKEEA